jgi:hypothetical protein
MRNNYRVLFWWQFNTALVSPEPRYFSTLDEARDYALAEYTEKGLGGSKTSVLDSGATVWRLPERGPALKVLTYGSETPETLTRSHGL